MRVRRWPRKIETEDDASDACEELMSIVSKVAGHRLKMILRAAASMATEPLEAENAKLRAACSGFLSYLHQSEKSTHIHPELAAAFKLAREVIPE